MTSSTEKVQSRRTLIVALVLLLLALPVIFGALLVFVGQRSPSVIHLPSWYLVPPTSTEPITLENVQITSSRGLTAISREMKVTASSVRDGTLPVTNKRSFHVGGVTFIQR